jgi:hypothetical protein
MNYQDVAGQGKPDLNYRSLTNSQDRMTGASVAIRGHGDEVVQGLDYREICPAQPVARLLKF